MEPKFVWLQAAVYWQTYDAFARVSMSVGINQLMLGMSYYILGCVSQIFASLSSLLVFLAVTHTHCFTLFFAFLDTLLRGMRCWRLRLPARPWEASWPSWAHQRCRSPSSPSRDWTSFLNYKHLFLGKNTFQSIGKWTNWPWAWYGAAFRSILQAHLRPQILATLEMRDKGRVSYYMSLLEWSVKKEFFQSMVLTVSPCQCRCSTGPRRSQ